jgi:2-desacetyl-2-hydroxyethyl bacteriochlorophyllide A dehydrogenase
MTPSGTGARALWVVGLRRAELREATLPPLAPGHVRVAARASGISRGTEALVFDGLVPESEHARMRCPFQEGAFPWPVKYGYCAVGTIVDGDAARVGERVFCLHPHQTLFDVPAAAALAIPADVPDRRATLAANLETAINALWDARPAVGDRIAVIGAGSVGLLAAWLATRIPGTRVTMVEPDPGRAATAAALGLHVAMPDAARGNNDLVLHASGRPEGLVRALELAGDEATIVELSWYGKRPVPLPLGAAFHARRLRLIASQVGQLPPERRPRWNHARRLALALALLRAPELDTLIGAVIPFAALPDALPRVLDTAHPQPWAVVDYGA